MFVFCVVFIRIQLSRGCLSLQILPRTGRNSWRKGKKSHWLAYRVLTPLQMQRLSVPKASSQCHPAISTHLHALKVFFFKHLRLCKHRSVVPRTEQTIEEDEDEKKERDERTHNIVPQILRSFFVPECFIFSCQKKIEIDYMYFDSMKQKQW